MRVVAAAPVPRCAGGVVPVWSRHESPTNHKGRSGAVVDDLLWRTAQPSGWAVLSTDGFLPTSRDLPFGGGLKERRGNDPERASYLRIEERELEAGGSN
jgi:hypothetical protein